MVIRTKKFKFVVVPGMNIKLININNIISNEELVEKYEELVKGDDVFIYAGEYSPELCPETHCATYKEIGGELFMVIQPFTHDELYLFRRMVQINQVGGDWERFFRRCVSGNWEIENVLVK